jgi:thiosulfate/3-mercaptopyruvate sulfurtransferase
MSADLLITPDQLAEQLQDPQLRVFDATVHLQPGENGYRLLSGRDDYATAHVPGAAFMDQIEALSDTTTKLGFSLPAADELAAGLGALGISRDTPVVLYATNHTMWATRAFWLLHYLGHDNVRVLDGGFRAWQQAQLPVAVEVSVYPEAKFEAVVHADRFVQLDEMQQIVGNGETCVVSALPEPVYTGAGGSPYGRAGHIPGSLNLPYDKLLNEGAFLPPDELLQALRACGLAGDERVVAYCGGGISATIPAFARLLVGLGATAIYDGSMSEWVREGLPLTEGSAP